MRNLERMLILVTIVLGLCSFGCSQRSDQESTPPTGQQHEQAGTEVSGQAGRQTQWWQDELILDELALTEDQVRAINELMTVGAGDSSMQRQQERRMALRYLRVLNQEPYDVALADELSQKLVEALSSENRRRIENVRAIRDILTIEQWTTLWEVAPRALQIGRFRVLLGPKIAVTDGDPAQTSTP